MDVTYKNVTLKNCYIKVWRFEGTTSKLNFGVGYYANRSSEMLFSENYEIDNFILESPNPIEQSYLYLKSLDRFSAAVDI